MTNGYKKAITEKVKESVNNWIETLKKETPELLLTKQWQVLFPKGFNQGYNMLSVVTGSKKGKHLVAHVEFVLPTDLELDYDDLELVLKNEPYKESKPKVKKKAVPVPIDEPIDILNNLVSGINSFLSDLNINIPTSPPIAGINLTEKQQPLTVQPLLSTHPQILGKEAALPIDTDDNLIEKVKRTMLNSAHLPSWLKTIESREVFETLMQKLAEGFISYQQKLGRPVELKEFFNLYEQHLQEKNKLFFHCKYMGKPVTHDSNGWCTEGYCSKKPYHSTCSYSTLKFGTPND